MSTTSTLTPNVNPFFLAHFEFLERKKDKSNKYIVKCNYCLKDDLIHRESRLLNHITNKSVCPTAPDYAFREALRMLEQKLPGGANQEEEDSAANNPNPGAPKKRKTQSTGIEAFLERPVAAETSDEYHRKLIR